MGGLRKEAEMAEKKVGGLVLKEQQRKAALRAIDDISVSLADRGHVWSPFERRAYEKLVRLLNL